MLSYLQVRKLCYFLPPILSHRIQNKLYPTFVFQNKAKEFSSRSITGGILKGNSKDFIASQFYFHGYFEWRNIVLVKTILKRFEGNIIEVGANIGTETISYCHFCQQKVYAFEPDPENFYHLNRVKELNNYSNLKNFQLGVSDRDEYLEFKKAKSSNTGTGYFMKSTTGVIQLVTLDNFLLNKLKNCSTIIMDVEGFELNVLYGSKELIKRFKPFIILEVNSKLLRDRTGKDYKDVIEFFDEYGYVFRQISTFKLGKVSHLNFHKKSHVNWIAVPENMQFMFTILSLKIMVNAFNPLFKKFIW